MSFGFLDTTTSAELMKFEYTLCDDGRGTGVTESRWDGVSAFQVTTIGWA